MAQIISNNWWGGGTGLYKYKWSVQTYNDLPTTWLKVWDVYNVVQAHTTAPKFQAWSNLAWTGTEWDVLGWEIDLSEYQKKLVEWTGIDIDWDTNVISVDTTVIAQQCDIPTDNCQLANWCWYTTCTWTVVVSDLTPYVKSCDLCTVATTWKYCDLTWTPTIWNAKLTIQKNGTDVNSICMNATTNVTANISVPTDTSDLTNGAGFLTSSDLSGYQTTSCMVCNLSWADNSHYPSAKAVSDALQCVWAWDMIKSVYDPCNKNSNAFDYCNFINTPTIPTDNCQLANGCCYAKVCDIPTDNCQLGNSCWYTTCTWTLTASNISDTAYGSSWNGVTTVAPSKNAVYDKICTIDSLISTNATSSNKLMDKNYIDDSINSVTAYYITKNAQGDQWATYAELAAASTFYSWWVQRTPTKNDYTIVLDDENHDNATTRYIYNSGWEYQYTVNETALTQSQLDALNSWITAAKVSTYDWYATSKQDALTASANIDITCNKVSATNNYIITEAITCTTYTWTLWVAPYNTSYCYTNICINPDSWVVWREWSVYTFDIDTKMIATSACRNVRVKIWSGDYIPVMSTSSILAWSSYFTKANTRQYMYSTKYQSCWALHLFTDSNTTYSAMSNSEATTWTCTSWRSIAACTLKCAINYYAPISDTAYWSSWDGKTTTAPSQNAVYDKINAMCVVPSGWSCWQVLTNTWSGYAWCAASWGDVMVSSDACNILTTWMKIWAWCQCDYDNLGTYDNNTVYLTI